MNCLSDTNFHHVSKKNTFKTKSLPPSCNNFPLPLMKPFPKPYNNFIMTFFFRSCRIIIWKIMVIFPKVLGCNQACEFVLAHGSIVHHFDSKLQKSLPFPSLWNLTWSWAQLNKNWVYFVVPPYKSIHNV
jgi:hypothetical protein